MTFKLDMERRIDDFLYASHKALAPTSIYIDTDDKGRDMIIDYMVANFWGIDFSKVFEKACRIHCQRLDIVV